MLIAFEGLDGSGKETQTRLLEERLNNSNIKAIRFEFPNYGSKYSVFVEGYLRGEFGSKLNPYLVSTFFGLERFGIYVSEIREYINKGYIVICDRYIYSNLIYQGSFMECLYERDKLFDWILDFEYNICSLPKEDMVFFMDLSLDINFNILNLRSNRDIYEGDYDFLKKCYSNAKYISSKYNFINVKCDNGVDLYSIYDINNSIYSIVLDKLGYKV